MKKDEFITEIKSYLPFDCHIDIKNVNNNLIRMRRGIFSTKINIHPVFLKADRNILQDIINFILQRNKASIKESKRRISRFFDENREVRSVNIIDAYKTHDIKSMLGEIILKLSSEYSTIDFGLLKITWGKKYNQKRRRSIRFGSFDRKYDLIRMNPELDSRFIPAYFVRSIIYHEAAHFITEKLGLNSTPHNKHFREILKNVDPELKKSNKWEKENKAIFFRL